MARRTAAERVGRFSRRIYRESLTFIGIHVAWFGSWILVNTLKIGVLTHFDVSFPTLDTIAAVEAIFLASFIVMRQARLSRRSDKRDHLVLQVLILAKEEVTAVLEIKRQVAAKVGLSGQDVEITQLSQNTSIDDVATSLKESLVLGMSAASIGGCRLFCLG